MSQGVRGRPHILFAAIFPSQISNLNETWKCNSVGRRSARQRGPPPREVSVFTWSSSAVHDLFEWHPRPQASVGCRRHRGSARFPLEPPFSDCGIRVKEFVLISFVRPRRRLFFRPDRVSTPPSRADAVKAGRSSAATEGLALAASSTVACSSVRADKKLVRRHQVPAGSPFSPWSGIAPPHHGIRRLQGPMSLAH